MQFVPPVARDRRLKGASSLEFRIVRGILVVAGSLLAAVLPAQTTYEASFGHWNDPSRWSNGVPDAFTPVSINHTASAFLPDLVQEGPASARSLTLVDGDNSGAHYVSFYDGMLNLTPAAIETLTVGAADPLGQARMTNFSLSLATLNSTGFATIGKRTPGSGELEGWMDLSSGSAWYHSSGLIEVGGNGGKGRLTVSGNSIVAGGPLSGVGQDPRLVIHGDSFVEIEGTGRFDEIRVNSYPAGDGFRPGLNVYGLLETRSLILGDTERGKMVVESDGIVGFARLGEVTVNLDSEMYVHGIATAESVRVNDGLVSVATGQMTVASPFPIGSLFTVLRVGADAGSSGEFRVVAGGDLLVQGAGIVGDHGVGTLSISEASTATFTGNLTVGASSSDGQGTGRVDVGAGSRLIAQNLYVGTSQNEMFGSVQLHPPGTGMLHLAEGGVVEVAGLDTGFFFQPGVFFNGTRGTISGKGTIEFSGPVPGTLINLGTITPGDSPGLLTIDGNLAFKIPFGFSPQGGTLEIELGGLTGGVEYDVLHVMGNVDLTGGILELSLLPSFTPGPDDIFNFLLVDGFLTGTFASLVDHTGLGLTLDDLVYGEHGVSFTRSTQASVPDPAPTAGLLGLAITSLVFVHRRIPIVAFGRGTGTGK